MGHQPARDFAAPKLDGLTIQPGDACDCADSRSLRIVGEHPNIPAALRFRHLTQQEVPLVVALHDFSIGARGTGTTFTAMDIWIRF